MKRRINLFILVCCMLILTACGSNTSVNSQISTKNESSQNLKIDNTKAAASIAAETADKKDALNVPAPSAPAAEEVLLKPGDSGDKVTALQKQLFTTGYDLIVDGFYGNETSGIIKKIQTSNNLPQTGNLDKSTSSILNGLKVVRAYVPPQKPSVPVPAAPPVPKGLASIPDIQTSPGNAQQVVVVLAPSYGTIQATYKTYEKVNGYWQLANTGSAVTGLKGFSDNRKEGDLTSPTGKYDFAFMFGNAENPGVKFPYRKVQDGDYWVSNKIVDEYNVWMHYDGSDPDERLYDYEALWKQPLYKYAAVIDFNYGPGKVLGKGSGIFLHIAPYSGGGTLGCIGVSESNLVNILKWLDPAKNPVIIMGVKGHI